MSYQDGHILPSWKDFIKYPNLIYMVPPETKDILDTLQDLVPIVWKRDRVGTFLEWRRQGLELGLITIAEGQKLSNEMIHGCGGM